ncbi:sulfotransferase family protein [Leptolyngbya sp. FACHB-1515]
MLAAGIETETDRTTSGVTWRHSLLRHYVDRYDCVFTFVRHPLTWYESWWKFQTWLNWKDHEPGVWHPQKILERCESNDFSKFIRLCIQLEPAYVTRMYEWYIGPPEGEFVDFVGRYEHLTDDLIQILRLRSVEFDEAILRAYAPANVSLSPLGKPVWDEALKAQILELEAPVIKRFYGDEINSDKTQVRSASVLYFSPARKDASPQSEFPTNARLRKQQDTIQRLRKRVKNLEAKLEASENEVVAMKTSKFWQLRSHWMKLKAKFPRNS